MRKDATLEEAKQYLRKRWTSSNGAICPCCHRRVKLQPRRLNASMAASLIWLLRKRRALRVDWVPVTDIAPRWVHRSRELPKLQYWSLVEPKMNEDDPTKRDSGIWRPTRDGVLFARNALEVPSHAYIYNTRCWGFTETTTDIREALGRKFDYEELLSASVNALESPERVEELHKGFSRSKS